MTDFENAAFSIFIVLLTRAILSFNLNFYMPISKVSCHKSTKKEEIKYSGARKRFTNLI